MHLRTLATVVGGLLACLLALPGTAGSAAGRDGGPTHQSGRAAYNSCRGSWDSTKSTPIRTPSGRRWGTSYLKVRYDGDKRGFCGRVVLRPDYRNTSTVVSFRLRSYAEGGAKLGEVGGQMFGSKLDVATFIGNGILPGESATYAISVRHAGHRATAKTVRLVMH